MFPPDKADAVIIGGGLAGSSMAIGLAKAGWNTVLMDQNNLPKHKVCGEFLSPESIAMLHVLGLQEAVDAIGPAEIDKAILTLANGATLTIPMREKAMGISRYQLDFIMQQRAEELGALWLGGTSVSAVKCNENGTYLVQAYTKGGQEPHSSITAKSVIAAWGRHPRADLAVNDPAVPSSASRTRAVTYVGIKAHYEEVPAGGAVELYFFRGGYIGLCPIEEGRTNVTALMTERAFQEAGKSVAAAIESASTQNPALRKRLAVGSPIVGSLSATSPVRLDRQLKAWSRFPLIGDAAVMIPPLCGDGMAMALRSAQLGLPLAHRYLYGDLTMDGWQIAYTRELTREFTSPVRMGKWLQGALSSTGMGTILFGLGKVAPFMSNQIFRATRLRG
ncbi:hypothetical protein SY83_22380 [Paenibacillus swuensis]|uniref:FAD-binding domain-containing protein n=1 Tax=Paenibacillus swuensis TaxID=1178515 RepID=A0A172TNF6_9BACL|nr:NAD(P)/FAD-dependent oxidoreductase [Paenibacillus swuensis]ANE48578.1 hypothetical protein SY83_22380 [Paenibacillus swuensis]